VRPVNLIPPEEQRGEHAPLRTGPLPYILVGALVAVLVAVAAMVLLDNQISDREGEVAKLEQEDAVEAARALRLSSYTQFQSLSEQRVATVSSLADSRFDWERVMRELSLVLPDNAWLVSLNASVAPGAGGGSSSGGNLRGSVPGPALELTGCATGQEAVAGFVTALKDIDGVTRVGVQSSELGDQESGTGRSVASGSASGASGDECRTRNFIAKFEIVVAFDAAPVPASDSAGGGVPSPTEKAQTASAESSAASTESAGGG
jgi:Tfp pilus assembly protein PilN